MPHAGHYNSYPVVLNNVQPLTNRYHFSKQWEFLTNNFASVHALSDFLPLKTCLKQRLNRAPIPGDLGVSVPDSCPHLGPNKLCIYMNLALVSFFSS